MKWFSGLLKAAALAACLLLAATLWAQSDLAQAAAQAQKAKQDKPKQETHVWTNEDLPEAPEAMRPTGVPASISSGSAASDQSAAPAAAAPAGAPGQAAGAKPAGPVDMKALEDKLKNAHRDVDETRNVIQKLQDRIPNETGTWRDADEKLLAHALELLPGYQTSLSQVQHEYDTAQAQSKQQGQGQPAAPPPPPPSSPQ